MSENTVAAPAFGVGRVLSRGFAVMFRNIVPFGVLSLLVYSLFIVLIVTGALLPDAQTTTTAGEINVTVEDPSAGVAGLIGGGVVLYLLSFYVLHAALVYGTVADLRGRRAGIGDCIAKGLGSIFPVIGVALLTAFWVLFGMVLLIIPGFIALTVLWVAIPAAVVERPGVIRSLGRSRELTKGHRWQVFGIIILMAVLQGVAENLSEFLFALGSDPNVVGAIDIVGVVVGLLILILFSALWSVMSAVAYHDLRVAKEGVGTDEIAAVFD